MEKKFGRNAKAELENNGVETSALVLDKEYKYHHFTCPAGVDTRNRLYVINKGGAILYKCFNCGGSGHYRDKDNYSPIVDNVYGVTSAKNPVDYRVDPHPFTDEMMLWLLNYEIDPDEFPGVFSPASDGSLPISVYNGSEYAGYQRRYFNGVDSNKASKYITNTKAPYHYLIGKEHPDVVFVVEDLLSSYKIWSLGYSVVALLGTTLKGHWPSELNNPKRVVVWLDNDSAGHVGAITLVRELNSRFPHILYTMFDRQPKEVPYVELTSICGAFK